MSDSVPISNAGDRWNGQPAVHIKRAYLGAFLAQAGFDKALADDERWVARNVGASTKDSQIYLEVIDGDGGSSRLLLGRVNGKTAWLDHSQPIVWLDEASARAARGNQWERSPKRYIAP